MTKSLKTAIAASLMGIGALSGMIFYDYSEIEGTECLASVAEATTTVDAEKIDRPDVKRLVEMAKTEMTTTTETTQTTVVSTKKVSETKATSDTSDNQEQTTIKTEPPQVTTTIEWYVSDPNGFAIPVDAYGETLGYYPDCEPAGIILPEPVEETTTTVTTSDSTYSTESKSGLPEYGSDEYLLAYAMARESSDFTDAYYVGSVILNRRDDSEFPDSILEILQQPLQYDWGVTTYERSYIYDDKFYDIAKELLGGKRLLPKNVVYQAQFRQGSGTYLKYKVHYYCFK